MSLKVKMFETKKEAIQFLRTSGKVVNKTLYLPEEVRCEANISKIANKYKKEPSLLCA